MTKMDLLDIVIIALGTLALAAAMVVLGMMVSAFL